MIRSRSIRFGLAACFALFLAACGSDVEDVAAEPAVVEHDEEDLEAEAAQAEADQVEDDPQVAETVATTTVPTTTTAPPSESTAETTDSPTTTAAVDEATATDEPDIEDTGTDTVTDVGTTPDDPVDGESGELGDEDILALVSIFDVSDPEQVAGCVRQAAIDEDVVLDDDFNVVILGVIRCDNEAAIALMRQDFAGLETSSEIAATPEQIDCSFESTIRWLSALPLAEASVLDRSEAPQGMVDALVSDCGISESDAEFLLNEA